MANETMQAQETAVPVADQEGQSEMQQLAVLNEQRMATYGLISRLYRVEVDQQTLDGMREMLFPASTGNKDVDEGYRLIATYLSRAWENSITELAVDYVRVFVGATNEIDGAAFPFESVYTSEKHLIMQAARDEVLAIYRAYGMKKSDDWKEAEDHVAVELEFMKALCQHIDAALQQDDGDQATELFTTQLNFLNDHLLSWTPLMTRDMRKFAKTDFYRGLSYLTDGYLQADKEFLTNLLAED
jgi:TorA maturation chaperone TorD